MPHKKLAQQDQEDTTSFDPKMRGREKREKSFYKKEQMREKAARLNTNIKEDNALPTPTPRTHKKIDFRQDSAEASVQAHESNFFSKNKNNKKVPNQESVFQEKITHNFK